MNIFSQVKNAYENKDTVISREVENQILIELKKNLNLKLNFIPGLIETNYYDYYHDVKNKNNGLIDFEKTKVNSLRDVDERSFRMIDNFN